MKKILQLFIVALMILGGWYIANTSQASSTSNPDEETLQLINEALENAVFSTLQGDKVTLEDFRGKVILIDIWETWCTPCIVSKPTLQKLVDDYPDIFMVLAVSPSYMDTPEQVREFVNSNDYSFTYVFGQQFSMDMGVQSIPFKIYVDPKGKFITAVPGSHGPERDYQITREIIEQYF